MLSKGAAGPGGAFDRKGVVMIARNCASERVPAAAQLLVAVGFFVIAGVCADIALDYHQAAQTMNQSFGVGGPAPIDPWRAVDGALYQDRRQCVLEFASYAVAAITAGLVFFPWRVFQP